MPPAKRKLIDKLRTNYPMVHSFHVVVKEFCLEDHPPSSAQWSYSGEDVEDRSIYTKLKHDKTTLITGPFDLLSPAYSAAIRRLTKKSGKLPVYHNDRGEPVTRSYDCEVTYEEEKEPNFDVGKDKSPA